METPTKLGSWMMLKNKFVTGCAVVALSLGAMAGDVAHAQGLGDRVAFSIGAQSLEDALIEFSDQTGIQVVASGDMIKGKKTAGYTKRAVAQVALAQILEGTGLTFTTQGASTVAIVPVLATVEVKEKDARFQRPEADVDGEAFSRVLEPKEDEDEVELEEIIVTGTNIRGIAPESSPVRTFDREDIAISGASTAQDFIETLTANFGGGANADIPFSAPGDNSGSFNTGADGSHGSGINLRGLGAGSTLVLLNGRRLAPSSGIGDFVDISMIPASAIERVEILTDGASSIYGGDAVAGVANFVLRDDFDGVEASYRYGTVTEGGLTENRASATAGKSWNTGNALVVYEYFNRGNLSAGDRSFSQSAPLPHDLLPGQNRHSVLASASQEITLNLKLFADFIFSTRESDQAAAATGLRTRSNPSTDNLNVSAGGAWKLSNSWYADFAGTYSEVAIKTDQSGDRIGRRQIDSNIWTADAKASGTVFDLPGGEVKLALGGHLRTESFTNFNLITDSTDRDADRDVYAVFGEAFIPIIGADNAVPGIERLEINVSGRFEDYSDFGSTVNSKVGVLWAPVEALRFRGSYSTSFKPPSLGRVGAADLTAGTVPISLVNTVFGTTAPDPSIADIVFVNVFGTDKNLDAETSRAFTGGVDFTRQWGRHDLSFSATYFDIDFEGRFGFIPVPDNRHPLELPNIAFSFPETLPAGAVVFFPSQAEIDALLAMLDTPLAYNFGVDPSAMIEAISYGGLVSNLALTSVAGLDFDVSYGFDSDIGSFSLGLDGTYLADFEQQAAITTPVIEQVSTLFNPVDLRMRGRAGFARNGVSANLFINYTNDYRSDDTATAVPIDAWTTVDINLSYDTREKFGNAAFDNMVFRLSVINLFDENPPAAPGDPVFGIFGFDPTNASPLGRFISFEITRKW